MTAILGMASLAPPAGERRVATIGDEGDKSVRRWPRLDRLALQAARTALGGASTEGLGLVVGTGYGGLQATVEFLEGLATRGAAFGSPTAFHQSVHHSPAGQISIALKITGPSLTSSARELAGEAALKEGVDLLALKRCQRVLVVWTEEVVPALEAAFRAFDAPFAPQEGAAALLLGTGDGELEVSSVSLAGKAMPMLRASAPVDPIGGLIRLIAAAHALGAGQSAEVHSVAFGGTEASVTVRRR